MKSPAGESKKPKNTTRQDFSEYFYSESNTFIIPLDHLKPLKKERSHQLRSEKKGIFLNSNTSEDSSIVVFRERIVNETA